MDRYKVLVGGEIAEPIDRYTSSFEFDKLIAKHVAKVMLIHVINLLKKGILERDVAKPIVKELLDIMESDGEKLYQWAKEKKKVFEDIFEAVEIYLYDVVGPSAGSIAVGRSRNDHIATVLRLYLRDRVLSILRKIIQLRRTLIKKAVEYRNTLFPFYTHAQLAQCGSASLYFLTYEQALADIFQMLKLSLGFLGQNPLGSGASAGAMVFMDLDLVSEDLCLRTDLLPPYYLTGSRLFLLYILSILTLLMSEIGRFVEDVMLFTNAFPQGLEIPRQHISTSSIMPHKRNLVTLEIARAKVSKVLGFFTGSIAIYKSLPYGYNLDFQELNMVSFEILRDVEETLDVVENFLANLKLVDEGIKKYLDGKPCWSSDLIEYIAISTKKPLRELYAELAKVFQQYLSGDAESLKNFLAKYRLDETVFSSIYRLRPFEKMLDNVIEQYLNRLSIDENEVEQVLLYLRSCSEMLIKDAIQV
jgi:argininosuccinate lyase